VSLLETIYHASGMGGGNARVVCCAARPAPCARQHLNSLAAIARQHPSPLRHRQRFLRACGSAAPWLTPAPITRRLPATLDEAQFAKMDHVCRKFAAERRRGAWVEAGCGWGTLAPAHGAPLRRAGCAPSTSRTSRSCMPASGRRARGLAARVEYVEDDYRNIAGVLRCLCVGRYARARGAGETTRRSGHVAYRCLGGRGFAGSSTRIGRNHPATLQPWIEKRIFPGGLPAVAWGR